MAEQINKINESLYQANIDLVDKNKKLENEIEKLKLRLETEIDISNGMLETIERAIEYIEIIQHNESYGVKEKDYLKLLDILKGE